MLSSHWLSIEEIARLWAEETGRDPLALKTELETWFTQFINEPHGSGQCASETKTTNRLVGFLGSRHIERTVFEDYCREQGIEKPKFWCAEACGSQSESSQNRDKLPELSNHGIEQERRYSESKRRQKGPSAKLYRDVSINRVEGERTEPEASSLLPNRPVQDMQRRRIGLGVGLAVLLITLAALLSEQSVQKDGSYDNAPAKAKTPDNVTVLNDRDEGEREVQGDVTQWRPRIGGEMNRYGIYFRTSPRAEITDIVTGLNSPIEGKGEAPAVARQWWPPSVGVKSTILEEQNQSDAQQKIAYLTAEIDKSEATIERLQNQLAATRRLSNSPRTSDGEEEKLQRDRILAKIVASARVVALQRKAELADRMTVSHGNLNTSREQKIDTLLSERLFLENILLETSDYVNQEVVVTGEVVRLAEHYWVLSENGYPSLLLDINLPPDEQERLAKIDSFANTTARIRGKILRKEADEYLISVIELTIIESFL